MNEKRNILGAVPQRRNHHRKDAQPVKEIAAELSRGDQFIKVPVRRGNDPHVAGHRPAIAETFELLFLQHSQQLRLQFQGNLAHLIQEKCSLMRQLKSPDPLRDGARKCAFLVPKKFAFKQPRRHGRAVDLHKRVGRSGD